MLQHKPFCKNLLNKGRKKNERICLNTPESTHFFQFEPLLQSYNSVVPPSRWRCTKRPFLKLMFVCWFFDSRKLLNTLVPLRKHWVNVGKAFVQTAFFIFVSTLESLIQIGATSPYRRQSQANLKYYFESNCWCYKTNIFTVVQSVTLIFSKWVPRSSALEKTGSCGWGWGVVNILNVSAKRLYNF